MIDLKYNILHYSRLDNSTNVFNECFFISDKKSGAKRPLEATENSPVAVKIKSKTQEKTSGTTKLSSISRYIFNSSEVDVKTPYNIISCHLAKALSCILIEE